MSARRYVKYLDNIRRIQVGDYRIHPQRYLLRAVALSLMDIPPSFARALACSSTQPKPHPIRSDLTQFTAPLAPALALARRWPGTGPARHRGCAQDFLVSGADEFLVPKVDNTNVDRRESAAVRSTRPCGRCPHGSRVRTVHMHCTHTPMHTGAHMVNTSGAATAMHAHACARTRTHAHTSRACRHNPKYTQGTHGH